MRAKDGWDRHSAVNMKSSHLEASGNWYLFVSLFSDKTFTFFYFILTFGSSWSFTTLAARAIGLVAEPAAACKQQQLEKNPGKSSWADKSIRFPAAAMLMHYDQPVVGRKDED